MKDYVCGIDIGSSTLKLTLLASNGSVLGPFRREIETAYPRPAYAEQNADDWLALLGETLCDAFATGLVDKHHIIALIPDAATHTTVLLDEAFRPVRPAIMWNDQRSAALARACTCAEEVFSLTNHTPGPMWSLFQNLWVKTFEPEVWARVRYMLFAKDYLRYQLTGVYCTDSIDAEGTELYDVHRGEWSKRLCELLDFPTDKMPPVRRASQPAGGLTKQSARLLGLCENTPVYVGTTDTALEMLAAGAVQKGQATVKLATSGRICVLTDKPYPHEQLVNYSYVVDGLYYPGTGTRSGASSLRWYKDRFGQYETLLAKQRGCSPYAVLDEKAAAIPAGSEGLFYHPYLLGEFTPYSNDKLRASFIGASMTHTEAHFIAAIMEGVAYSLRDCFELVKTLGMDINDAPLLLLGGGAASRHWSGILASVLNHTVAIPRHSDSSLGGAMLAGVACGMFSDVRQAVARCCGVTEEIAPTPRDADVYNRLFPIYRKIVGALTDIYEELDAAVQPER